MSEQTERREPDEPEDGPGAPTEKHPSDDTEWQRVLPLKETPAYAERPPVEQEQVVAELRRALLEIEWTSRRSTTTATLNRINDTARAALYAGPGPRPLASRVRAADTRAAAERSATARA